MMEAGKEVFPLKKNRTLLQTMKRAAPLALALLLLALPALAQEALEIGALAPVVLPAQDASGECALYCGPTQGFYRHGEAVLDTREPFVCFGQYDCWAMVAAGTPEAFGPVGWIEAAALSSLDGAAALIFEDALPVMIEEDAPLTDNPLSDAPAALATLPRGTQVTLLAGFGDWGYVQTELEGVPVRAFVPLAAIL